LHTFRGNSGKIALKSVLTKPEVLSLGEDIKGAKAVIQIANRRLEKVIEILGIRQNTQSFIKI
jgi:hypothetical protein